MSKRPFPKHNKCEIDYRFWKLKNLNIDIGQSIDFMLSNCRNSRWDIVGRAMNILEAGFVKRLQ